MESAFNISAVLYLIFSLAIGFGIIAGIAYFIYKLATKRQTEKPRKIFIIMPFAILLIATVAFILNMGWYRVILIIFPIVPLHFILFFFTSLYSSDFAAKSKPILMFSIINYIIFPLTYLLLPDGGDTGGMYMFFGLIKNEALCSFSLSVAVNCFFASIAFILLQLIMTFKLKRKERLENEKNQNI